jgi:hypothetical protein
VAFVGLLRQGTMVLLSHKSQLYGLVYSPRICKSRWEGVPIRRKARVRVNNTQHCFFIVHSGMKRIRIKRAAIGTTTVFTKTESPGSIALLRSVLASRPNSIKWKRIFPGKSRLTRRAFSSELARKCESRGVAVAFAVFLSSIHEYSGPSSACTCAFTGAMQHAHLSRRGDSLMDLRTGAHRCQRSSVFIYLYFAGPLSYITY